MRAFRSLRWRGRGAILLVLGIVAATATYVQLAKAPPAEAAIGPIIWQDEFNSPAGTPPDASRWKFDIGGSGWGNNEREYYTDSTSNAAHNGQGQLVITARRENPANYQCFYGRCEYTSARLLTAGKFTHTYGRYEARIRIPRGQGIWPAFWMLGDNLGSVGWPACGEVDIMENIGREPNLVHGTIHGPGYSGAAGPSSSYPLPGGGAFADAFHTYTVDWEPNTVTWYVDGVQYGRKSAADVAPNQWAFDHPFFMILNVAVGGDWPGFPDASTQFPQEMLIDWVRVSSYDTGSGNRLAAGQRLVRDQQLASSNGRFHLVMQTDGNLVIYDGTPGQNPIWATGTWNLPTDRRPTHTDMQTDGNLVLYNDTNQPAWATGTFGPNYINPYLEMQDDGNLVIYHNGRTPVWASGTTRP